LGRGTVAQCRQSCGHGYREAQKAHGGLHGRQSPDNAPSWKGDLGPSGNQTSPKRVPRNEDGFGHARGKYSHLPLRLAMLAAMTDLVRPKHCAPAADLFVGGEAPLQQVVRLKRTI
jgi:hypothetical protein